MFEVGEQYEITRIEEGAEGYSVFTVIEVELPLIKVRDGADHEFIINTHSPNFVSANKPRPPVVMTDSQKADQDAAIRAGQARNRKGIA